MTRSEAIDMLRQICSYLTAGNPVWRPEPIREACDMAIEALTEREASANDLISRQAAIDAIFSEPLYKSGMKKRDADAVVPAIYEKIKSLPAAEPQITLESAVDFLHSIGWMQEHDRILTESAERRGKWIPKDERWHCTLCDGIAPKGIRWKFCPICGARMEGTERQRAAEGNDAGSKREET